MGAPFMLVEIPLKQRERKHNSFRVLGVRVYAVQIPGVIKQMEE